MTHPLLFNPFRESQERAQEEAQEEAKEQTENEQRTAWSVRSTPVCERCRSDDIISQATAQWSNEKQEWELANTFAQPAHCNSCNGPCEILWMPLN